ncbi:nuclear pore complex protein Nup98-Nup96 isoform X2 [Gouania willdenowi]|uniref:nuclear pore complex protein Nup98-Nup96 isoform X2 n=1 Tax=Gouania willdenowi TaxID=441366 RepID=UPI0010566B85|nr:nuclear pore complex protein Nup98-Nup96 isoform X2 [Gouania willdenowi]
MFNKSFATPFGGGTGAFGASSTFGQQNAGFGTTNSFGTSGFGTTTNSGGLFGSTQNKPGGLFGSTNFSQPVTSSTSAGFGFGAASGASSLFGNTGGGAGGGLFSQPNNAFSANKPTSFGSFGTSTSSGGGGLFGAANATSNPFGGGATSLFGGSGFTSTQQQQQQQQQQPGTTVKFNPPSGSDTMVKAGVTTSINTKHQCITAMKEYENKSLEELRLEDYQAGRKGPSNPMAAGTSSLFGAATSSASTGLFGAAAPNAGFSFGQNKSTFGAAAPGGFGTTSGSLFGQNQPPNASLFKPFGQTSTTQSSGFSFGNTNTIGQANTSSMGLFGNTAASQAGGLFGAAQTSTASGFGAATGLFGQTNPGFGNTGTQPSLFGNKSAGFGTTTTSAPSFGTGLFGNKPALTLGTGNNTSTFGFGANPAAGSLFGNKTTTGGLGTGLGTSFGTVGPGHSLFGNNQNKLGSTLGTMGAFGASGFNTGTSTLGFGATQQPVALSDPSAAAAQQQLLQQQLSVLAYSPYGDSPLFRNPLSDPKKEERLKPTNPTAQKALTTPTHYKLTPRPASRMRPKALPPSSSSKSSLFDGLDDEPPLTSSSFIPRRSIKKLVLKNMSSSQYSSVLNKDTHNGHSEEVEPQSEEVEPQGDAPPNSPEVSQFYVNPISKPLPQSRAPPSPQDTITELNMHRAIGLEVSSEDVSLSERDESVHEEQHSPHPAGVVLTRVGYYTIPSMDDLAEVVDENGECVVENFTIGRKGYGSIFFPGKVNVTNLNLDHIVHFRRKEVVVYPDDGPKPAQGEGLNRRAEVTLDGVWPNDKTSCSQIRSPERLSDINYEARLEKACRKQGARFLDYRPETGSWVFEVTHFSKYGLQDSDEDEDISVDPKKLKMAPPTLAAASQQQGASPPPLQGGVAVERGVAELDSDMADITYSVSESMLVGEDPAPPTLALTNEHSALCVSGNMMTSLGINTHTLQVMKASLFDDDDDELMNHMTSSGLVQSAAQSRPSGVRPTQSVSVLQPAPPSQWAGPSHFLLTPRVADPPIRTVGARRLGGPVPIEDSITQGKGALLMDCGLFRVRSFRVGWGPSWTLVHSGHVLGSSHQEDLRLKTDFSFIHSGARRPLAHSPYKVTVEQLQVVQPHLIKTTEEEEEEEESVGFLQRPLQISLKHCTISTPDGASCPLLRPQPGVEALHEYAEWIAALSETHGHAHPVLRSWCEVWTLCSALWGRLGARQHPEETTGEYEQQLDRRRSFSAWLSEGAAPRVEEEVALAGKGHHVDAVFSYLTGNLVAEACGVAQRKGDHRLSLLLAQSAGAPHARELLALQLSDWNQTHTDCFLSEERLRLFSLLSGRAVWQSSDSLVNVCAELDWKRCVGVHLWFLLPPTASVGDALCRYEAAFQGSCEEGRYACAPLPPYLEREEEEEGGRPQYDVCFHLLKLFSDRLYSLVPLLEPRSSTSQRCDFSLSWSLWNVLQGLNYRHLSSELQSLLHCSFSAQLEALGHWDMAVFVLLHLPHNTHRERAVRELLWRHVTLGEEAEQREHFLVERLLVPDWWIHEAKALRAQSVSDPHQQVQHLYRAGLWNQCHRLLIQHLASDCIINEEHQYLLEFLHGLSVPERSAAIVDWGRAGHVYLDYITVINTLTHLQQTDDAPYQLERLHGDVTSLCGRIQSLPCRTARDRLAQSEMAKRVANILRAVLTLQSDSLSVPLAELAPSVSRLPLPEDYSLQELRGLTQAYLRQLLIS